MTADPLAAFHPEIASWMRATHGAPTPIQRQAWPLISAGNHVLASAPTGSGKTLCAFLWALDRLLQGHWQPGGVRVLYVSPLKALNHDIQRNLTTPLSALRQRFREAGLDPPQIGIATRSGDTPASERQRMVRQPPEILITTPESLNLLLASSSGRVLLGGVRTLITDEVHAIAGNRRGVWLAAATERLVDLAGEYQRVALSATVRPLEAVAQWIGGYAAGADGAPGHEPRPVRIVHAGGAPQLDLRIEALEPDRLPEDGGLDALSPIARAVQQRCQHNRSTLVFCNSRQLAEKLAVRINEDSDHTLAWAHHGSLARELRLEVEQRLKAGELRAIVATSSLELGIDIGSLDEVVLVQSPPSVTSALQRIGRAGHGVGQTSRAVLHPTHPHDLLEAVAVLDCASRGDIEAIEPLRGCLDVLAQILIATLLAGPASSDALYDRIRRALPYRQLPRAAFDAVLHMLAGHHAGSRIAELRPRIHWDPDHGHWVAGRGAALAFRAGSGMIPDRGYFQLRHAHSQAKIGELDEEFVWENGPGRAFSLGSQQWRVQRVTHNDVFVLPAPEARHAPPFWRSEERDRPGHLATRLAERLQDWEQRLASDGELGSPAELALLDQRARTELEDYLRRQRQHSGQALPHRQHWLLERVHTGPGGSPSSAGQLIVHNMAGARVNRPWALALEAAWQARYGNTPDIMAGNDALLIPLESDADPDEVLALVDSANLDALLQQRLSGSGFFGARFRECAGRALLLPRRRPGERQPLWLNRLHAQRLLDKLQREPDFPILLETWRSCLQDEFELPRLRALLDEVADGRITVSHCRSHSASPFAAQLARQQINQYMYADDRPRERRDGRPATLLDDLLDDDDRRPRLAASTVALFQRRRRRLEAGWAPVDALDLRDWLSERQAIEAEEFHHFEQILPQAEWQRALPWWVRLQGPRGNWVVLREQAPALLALAPELRAPSDLPGSSHGAALPVITFASCFRAWLEVQPPLPRAELLSRWPGRPEEANAAIDDLLQDGSLLQGRLLEDSDGEQICLRQHVETMLRQQRARRRHLQPLGTDQVPAFLLHWQRVGRAEDMIDALEPLRGLPLPADRWEQFVLPARLGRDGAADLDQLLAGGALRLYGQGEGRIGFALAEELPALLDPTAAALPADLPPPGSPPVAIASLLDTDDGEMMLQAIWQAVWAGQLVLDSFETVRRGLAWNYAMPALRPAGNGLPRRRRDLRARLMERTQPYPGQLQRPLLPPPRDGLEELERARDRARLLLDRHGVVCPDLCRREGGNMGWRQLFRALRWLELSGEVTGGLFLDGLGGPQFALPEAVETLRDWDADESALPPRWIHAQDPASPCGLGLSLPGLPLPTAHPGNELVLGAGRILLTYRRGSGDLDLDPEADSDLGQASLAALAAALAWRPPSRQQLSLRRINGSPARQHACIPALQPHFDLSADHRQLTLQPRSPGERIRTRRPAAPVDRH